MKRSFAEFHAQRSAPELLQAVQQGQRQLATLRKRSWPHSLLGTTREEVNAFYEASQKIQELSASLQVCRQAKLDDGCSLATISVCTHASTDG